MDDRVRPRDDAGAFHRCARSRRPRRCEPRGLRPCRGIARQAYRQGDSHSNGRPPASLGAERSGGHVRSPRTVNAAAAERLLPAIRGTAPAAMGFSPPRAGCPRRTASNRAGGLERRFEYGLRGRRIPRRLELSRRRIEEDRACCASGARPRRAAGDYGLDREGGGPAGSNAPPAASRPGSLRVSHRSGSGPKVNPRDGPDLVNLHRGR